MYSKIKKIGAAVSLLLVAQLSSANAIQLEPTKAQLDAQKIIVEYKELRSSCLKRESAERKHCFAQLEAANKAYTAAKEVISQTSDTRNNVHLVSFL